MKSKASPPRHPAGQTRELFRVCARLQDRDSLHTTRQSPTIDVHHISAPNWFLRESRVENHIAKPQSCLPGRATFLPSPMASRMERKQHLRSPPGKVSVLKYALNPLTKEQALTSPPGPQPSQVHGRSSRQGRPSGQYLNTKGCFTGFAQERHGLCQLHCIDVSLLSSWRRTHSPL